MYIHIRARKLKTQVYVRLREVHTGVLWIYYGV